MAKPAAPASLTVTRLGDRDFRFSWPKVVGATSYGIRYLTGSQRPPYTHWVEGIRGTSFTGRRFSGEAAKYFVVYATNKDGNSGYSPVSGPWYLPVKAPTSLKVAAVPALSRVVLTWASKAYYQAGIEVARDQGGTVTTVVVGSGTGGNVGKSWTDTSVTGSVRYRVRHFVGAAGASTRVYSPWTAWTRVVFAGFTAPLAPVVALASTAVGVAPVVKVVHEPTDATAQTAVEVRYRLGAAAWTTVTGTTSSSVRLPSSLTAGVYDVQAKTRGAATDFGPWSAVQTLRVATRPVVTISAPVTPFTGGRATVKWSVTQAESLPQEAWTARLKRGSTVLESFAGVGTRVSKAFKTDLSNSTSYSVEVTVTCGGVTSTTTSKVFTTAFKPPAPPSLSAVWSEESGMHLVEVAPASSFNPSTQAETVNVNVYRSIDQGEYWEHLGEFESATSFADVGGLSAGETIYRVVAATDLGALATVEETVVTASPAIWIHGETGQGVGLTSNIDWSVPEEPAHGESVYFDGDVLPTWIEDSPKSRQRKLSASATLTPTRVDADGEEQRETLRQLVRGAGRVQVRLPDGDSITGALTSLVPSTEVSGLTRIQLTVEEAQ